MRPAMTDTTPDTAMPAEIAKLVERLTLTPDCDVRQLADNATEAASALRSLQKELDEQWQRANVLAQQNAYHKDRAEAAEARVAELEKALERIEVRTRSVPSDTAEDDKRDKYHANSIARRALTGGKIDE